MFLGITKSEFDCNMFIVHRSAVNRLRDEVVGTVFHNKFHPYEGECFTTEELGSLFYFLESRQECKD